MQNQRRGRQGIGIRVIEDIGNICILDDDKGNDSGGDDDYGEDDDDIYIMMKCL